MDENNIMETENFEEEESTDLMPIEESEDSEGGIGAGEVALGALAIVGAGFLLKKGYDGIKWCVSKAKDGIGSLKEKREAKKASKDQPAPETEETQEETPAEGEVLTGEVEETK